MPRYAYDRLTALDNSFLLLEKPNSYMHVASTLIFEAGPLRRPEGGIDVDAIRDATAAALPQIPRYRQKLKYIPIESHPVWVDDDRFNLDYHLRHTALPKPGSIAQLKALSARIMQQHLDRSRPLWEMWVVEGLEGDRFALISKVHHCMVDGVSGVDLLNTQLRTTPDRSIPDPVPYYPAARALGPRAAAPRADAPRGAAALRVPRRARLRARGDGRAHGDRGAPARRRRDPRHHAAPRLRHAAQSPDRPASALRLALDGRGRDQGGAQGARRLAERRGAHRGDGRRAALPRAPRREPEGPRLPRDGAGQRAQRGPARPPRQPRVGVDDRPPRLAPRPAPAARADRREDAGAEGVEAGRRRRGAHPGGRLDAVDARSPSAPATPRGCCPSTWW